MSSESSPEDAVVGEAEMPPDEEQQLKLADLKYLGQQLDDLLDGNSDDLPRYEDCKFMLTFGAKRIAKGLKALFEERTGVFIIFFPAPDPPFEPVPSVPIGTILVEKIIEKERDEELAHERALVEFGQHHVRVARLRAAMEDIAMQITRKEDDELKCLIDDYFDRYERALLLMEDIMKESALHKEFMSSPALLREAEERQQQRDVEECLRRIAQREPPVPDISSLCSICTPDYSRPPPPPMRQRVRNFPGLNWHRDEAHTHYFTPLPGSTSADGSQLNSPDSGLPHSPPPVNDELAMIHASSPPLELSMCGDDDCTASQCSTSRESSPLTMAEALEAEKVKQELRTKVWDLIGEENVKERRRPEHQKSFESTPSPQSEESSCDESTLWSEDRNIAASLRNISREKEYCKRGPTVESDEERKHRLVCTAKMMAPINQIKQDLRDAKLKEAAKAADEEVEATAKKQASINKRFALIMSLANQRLDRMDKEEVARKEERLAEADKQATAEWAMYQSCYQLPNASSAFSPPSYQSPSTAHSLAGTDIHQQQQDYESRRQFREKEKKRNEALKRKMKAKEEREKLRHEEEQKLAIQKAKEDAERRRRQIEERERREAEEEAKREAELKKQEEERAEKEAKEEAERQRLAALDREQRKKERKEREEEAERIRKELEEEKRRRNEEKRLAAEKKKEEEAKTLEERVKEEAKRDAERRRLQRVEDNERRKEENRRALELDQERKEEELLKSELTKTELIEFELEKKRKAKEELEAAVAVSASMLTPPITPEQPKKMSKSAKRRAKKIGSRLQSAESTDTLDSRESSVDPNENEETESEDGEQSTQPGSSGMSQEKFEVALSKSAKKKKEARFEPKIYVPPVPEVNEEDKRAAEKRKAFLEQEEKEKRRKEQLERESREATPESENGEGAGGGGGGGEANRRTRYTRRERIPVYSEEWRQETSARARANTTNNDPNATSYWVRGLYGLLASFLILVIGSSIGCSYVYGGDSSVCMAKIEEWRATRMPEPLHDYRIKTNSQIVRSKPPDIPTDLAPTEMTDDANCLLWVFKPGPQGASFCIRTPRHYRLSTFHDDTILTLVDQVGASLTYYERETLKLCLLKVYLAALKNLLALSEEGLNWNDSLTLEYTIVDQDEAKWVFRIPDLLAFLEPRLQFNPLTNERDRSFCAQLSSAQ